MASRGLLSRASRIKSKLQSALEATVVEVEDVSYQHAGHAAVKDSGASETHFNVKIVSSKFDGQNLVKRHRKYSQRSWSEQLIIQQLLNKGSISTGDCMQCGWI
ncbi:unnamed protein product [Coffea canephora]|uniref:Uncharacterized protein n=1 Tax=Coffea canephora TaxID=49390 RepID=A0A068TQH4_COFCA|nr:unnamed protein product [Coffea canephora]